MWAIGKTKTKPSRHTLFFVGQSLRKVAVPFLGT